MLDSGKAPSQSVRYLNELRALDVLFRDGAMSRAELARTLGLNRSTTGSIVSSLLAESLVVERRRDRPPSRALKPGARASTSSSIPKALCSSARKSKWSS